MNGTPIKFRAWDKRHKKLRDDWWQILPKGSKKLGPEILLNKNFVFMLFTGFTDRNGNEIYGGDIVDDVLSEQYWPVVWEFGGFWINDSIIYDYASGDQYRLDDILVVGNVYENNDLVEYKK